MKHEYIVNCDILENGVVIKWANLTISWEDDEAPNSTAFLEHIVDTYHKNSQWSYCLNLPQSIDVRVVGVFKL
jgi:hypothetical protein